MYLAYITTTNKPAVLVYLHVPSIDNYNKHAYSNCTGVHLNAPRIDNSNKHTYKFKVLHRIENTAYKIYNSKIFKTL